MQNRRDFLKKFTLLSTGLCAPTFLVRSIQAARVAGMSRASLGNPNRILVVVELAGGCDGLNTVIPYTNDAYYAARPNLGIRKEQGILTLSGELGLHPGMTGFKQLWDEARLSIVHGAGYPNPNRSHFRSRDIWHTAEPEKVSSDGWLASYFEELESEAVLKGVNIGGRVPRSMVSQSGSSPSIQSIDTYELQSDEKYPLDAGNKNAAFQQILSEPQNRFPFQEYVGQTVLDATVSSVQLLEGQANYNSSIAYPNSAFSNNLQTIARIIAADLGVTVFYTTIGGFDTHSGQVVAGSNMQGVHANLLSSLSSALKAFTDDLIEMGRFEDVLVMTFSEFGRRLKENGSLGSDHGTANQMFLLGGSLNPGNFGEHPGLAAADLDPIGDMIYRVDFRSVYATVLSQWLGADASQVLGANWYDPRLTFV